MHPADQEFIRWVEEYVSWYERQARKWGRILGICRVLTLVSSLTAIVVAAASSKDFFADLGKWLIVGGGLLSTLSSELLGQFQVRRMEDLRESGHLEMENLRAYARDKFDEFDGNRKQINKIKDEIREKIRAIETAQHRQFVDIISDESDNERSKNDNRDKDVQEKPDKPI